MGSAILGGGLAGLGLAVLANLSGLAWLVVLVALGWLAGLGGGLGGSVLGRLVEWRRLAILAWLCYLSRSVLNRLVKWSGLVKLAGLSGLAGLAVLAGFSGLASSVLARLVERPVLAILARLCYLGRSVLSCLAVLVLREPGLVGTRLVRGRLVGIRLTGRLLIGFWLVGSRWPVHPDGGWLVRLRLVLTAPGRCVCHDGLLIARRPDSARTEQRWLPQRLRP